MVDAIDTSGPRPWPDTATEEDIKPGVILAVYIKNHGVFRKAAEHTVVSSCHGSLGEFYVANPEQVAVLTYEQIMGQFDGLRLGDRLLAEQLGIKPDRRGEWWGDRYCIVTGTYNKPE